MRRIDFLGVPGSGKTTVCREIERSRMAQSWFMDHEAKKNTARILAGSEVSTITNIFKGWLSRIPGFGWAGTLLVHGLLPAAAREALWESRESWEESLKFYIQHLGVSSEHPIRTFWNAEQFIARVHDVAVLEKFSPSSTVVFENSLTQRALLCVLDSYSAGDTLILGKCLTVLPHPSAVVYLRLSPERLAERIRQRAPRKTIQKHKNLSREELLEKITEEYDFYENAIIELKRHSIPVIVIDAEKDIQEIVAIIRKSTPVQ